MEIKQLVEEVNKAGYLAFHYPRLKKVALGGGKQLSYKEAIPRMKAMLAA